MRMARNLPILNRGEHVLKVEVEVAPEAFRNPVLTKKVIVNDWREGIDIADVDFKETFITEEEAATIRQNRLEKMQEILRNNGFEVTRVEEGSTE